MGCIFSKKNSNQMEKEESFITESLPYIQCQHCEDKILRSEFLTYYGFCKECRKKL